jgi:AcrR family transcriptional regulator
LPARSRDNSDARRQLILDEAMRVIGERGYGFTVQELAQGCGLSNAGLLHHFPSKERLFLAVLQEVEACEAGVMTPLVEAAAQGLRGDAARQAVIDVLRAMVSRSTAQPQLLRLCAKLQVEGLDPSHPAYAWRRRHDVIKADLFTKLIGPHVPDPVSMTRQLLAMIEGLCLRWLAADLSFDVVAEWERALTRLAPELCLQPPPGAEPSARLQDQS